VPQDSIFTPDQIDRAGGYHRPLYRALLLDFLLAVTTLGLLAPYGRWRIGPWWVAAPLNAAIALGLSTLGRLPLSFWRGWLWERRWRFSTQTLVGWALDCL